MCKVSVALLRHINRFEVGLFVGVWEGKQGRGVATRRRSLEREIAEKECMWRTTEID